MFHKPIPVSVKGWEAPTTQLVSVIPKFRTSLSAAKAWRLKLAAICGIMSVAAAAYGMDPTKSIYQFNCQNWTHQNGLPSDGISSIVQTKDGYIWLGTQKGLVRFDGTEFKVFNSNLPQQQSQEIRTLAPARDGGIWYGINNGSFGHFDGQNFSPIGNDLWNVPNMNAIAIRETRDGTVWLGEQRGLGRWVKGKADETFYSEDFGMALSFSEDPRGRVWVGTVEKGLFYWEGGKSNQIQDDFLKQHLVFAVAEDAEGQIWVGTEVGLRCYDANLKPKQIPTFNTEVKALLVDRHGVLWIGTSGDGVARYQGGEFTFLHKEDGLINDNVLALMEDTEGSLWVGTQEGLSQLTDLKLPIYSKGEGLLPGSAHSVWASQKGGFWLTTSRGLAYFDGKNAVNYTNEGFLPNVWVRRAYEARNGDVYFIDGNKSLVVMSGDKIVSVYTNSVWPTDIAEDAQGIIVGMGPKLFRLQDGKMIPFPYKGIKTPVYYWINNIRVARDGSIWVASNNGVVRIKDGDFDQWTNPEGATTPATLWISEDETEPGVFWAGMSVGIGRIKDRQFKIINTENGLLDNRVSAIVSDDQGSFWVDSNHGIFRVTRKSLNDFADGKADRIKCESFEGAKSVKFAERSDQEPSGCKTADGRIWFPCPLGVIMINPTNLFTNQIAPPVYIQQIRVNGQEIKDRKIPALAPGKGELEIHFTALSYIAPAKVQIHYRLKGYDAGWVEAGNRRIAEYMNLKPGKYSFQVLACNADGVWNTTGDSFDIEFPLPFYQTSWFAALCSGLAVIALLGAYRWLVRRAEVQQRQLQEANDLLEAKVAKRTDELARANGALREEIVQREKADKALAEQRNLLRTLIDNLPDKVFIKDTQSRILLCNLAHVRGLNAASPEAVVDRTDFDFHSSALAQKYFADEQKVLRTGEAFQGEEKTELAGTGEIRWCLTTKVPLRDNQGEIVGLAGISHDITERKEWENKQEMLHKELVDASRKAGMAEVATGVLHNVGNVLNSVNISATMVAQKIRNSKSANLAKVVELLRQHNGNLAQFLTVDEKGRQLPGYLANLAEHLETEKISIVKELDSLVGNIDHIKEIVSMQQANAKLAGVVEVVPVAALVEDALKINVAAFQRHDVALVRQFEEVPSIMVDRHKVLQILVNLLNNAKYACDESGRRDKQVTVRIKRAADNRIQIGVIDNGAGIVPENLTRIFAHGFTTRKNGHGFGLHSGALAAMELGGKLTAHSAGRGAGASFFLELPVENGEAASPESN